MSDLQKGTFNALERCELKYHIPASKIKEVQEFIAPYCFEDQYSQSMDSGYYRVKSLYLDTRELSFNKAKKRKEKDRFNMRIRVYGEEINYEKFFLEIKRKRQGAVDKYRGVVETNDLAEWMITYMPGDKRDKVSLFHDKKTIHQAYPILMTSYLRNAWFGKKEEYARVTFDRELRHEVCREYEFKTIGEYATDYNNYFEENCDVVLELKATLREIPIWMKNLVLEFGLKKKSFSKYGSALRESKRREGKFWL